MAKRKIIYILISVVLAGFLLGGGYFLGMKNIFQKEPQPEITVSREMEAGPVGEIMVKEEETGIETSLVSPTMPPAIFSTAGTVIEVKTEGIIIRGDGFNFADGVSRNIAVAFTSETSTFGTYQAFYWKGLAGLKKLEEGMKVLIEGEGNIRGKTEIQAKTINIL